MRVTGLYDGDPLEKASLIPDNDDAYTGGALMFWTLDPKNEREYQMECGVNNISKAFVIDKKVKRCIEIGTPKKPVGLNCD